MDLQNILKTYFGYDEFRNGQDKLIESIIEGRDARVFDSCIVKKSLKPLERLYFFVKFHISILSTFEPCVII